MDYLESLKKNKGVILLVIIFIAAFFVFSGGEKVEDSALLVSKAVDESSVGKDLVAILLELRSLELDESIFEDGFFTSLEDFSLEIGSQPAGRENPFAPIGVDPSTPIIEESPELDSGFES